MKIASSPRSDRHYHHHIFALRLTMSWSCERNEYTINKPQLCKKITRRHGPFLLGGRDSATPHCHSILGVPMACSRRDVLGVPVVVHSASEIDLLGLLNTCSSTHLHSVSLLSTLGAQFAWSLAPVPRVLRSQLNLTRATNCAVVISCLWLTRPSCLRLPVDWFNAATGVELGSGQ